MLRKKYLHLVRSQALKELRKTLLWPFKLEQNHDVTNTVLLVGTGRSGTTWVSNVINYNNEYRYIFEPFHWYNAKVYGNQPVRMYLRETEECHQFHEVVGKILTGRAHSRWMDQLNRNVLPRKRLIKDVRCHLFSRWVYRNFPGVSIVLLLRHPFAVALSKVARGWDSEIETVAGQDKLREDFEVLRNIDFSAYESPFEQHVLLWCIENYVFLQEFSPQELLVVFYENLILRPEEELQKIGRFLHCDYDAAIFDSLGRPSTEAHRNSAIITGRDGVAAWRHDVGTEQAEKAGLILEKFKLTNLYDDQGHPNREYLHSIMK